MIARVRLPGLLVLVLGVFTSMASLTPETSPEPNRQEPPQLRDELASLRFLIGDWQIDSNFRFGDGRWEQTKADSVIAPIMGGMMLEEHYQGTQDGHAFEARALYGRSVVNQKLQRAWIDAEHGGIALYEGVPTIPGGVPADGEIPFDMTIELRGQTHLLRHGCFKRGRPSFYRRPLMIPPEFPKTPMPESPVDSLNW